MSTLKHRPSLPIGMTIPDFPPIQRALYTDPEIELYLLEANEQSSLVLIILPGVSTQQSILSKQLTRWWSDLGSERITVKKAFRHCTDGIMRLEAVIHVAGKWLGERDDSPIEEAALYSQFEALVDLAIRAADENQIPNYQPSFLWKSFKTGETQLTSIVVTPMKNNGEEGAVQQVGSAFYWLATGVDLSLASMRQSPKPLSGWCKTAGKHLSSLTSKCLADIKSPDRIRSLSALREQLVSRGQAQGPIQKGSPLTDKGNRFIAGSVESKGLAKVAGMQRLKGLLEKEIVKPLRDPEPFRRYGLNIPNGILLFGPPGCGKTYIARQLAEELGYYFIEIIPSEVAGIHIHETVLRIRELFETAIERAPSIVFIDEFDAMVPLRAGLGGHQQYKSEEVNEFLAQLNSCAEKKVFVIAATNEPDKIDRAILRTGRLDKLVYVGPPDTEARTEMLRLHLSKRPIENSLALASVSLTLDGYAASDIKFLVDEAARLALSRGVPISSDILMEASRRIPPSVTKEAEQRYDSFKERG